MKFYIHFLLLILPLSVNAQQMYKSVDEKGNVSYSSTPPAEAAAVKKVAPPTPLTDEQVLQGQQQHERIKNKSELLATEREKRAMQNAKEEPMKDTVESLELRRKSSLNDPGRAGQNPEPGKPVHPIQPVPTPLGNQPARPAQLPARTRN